MRVGLISDVHGNLQALQATVAALRALGAQRWICAGDVIGYGPHPNECVELVVDLGALVVAGNHELVAAGMLPDAAKHGLAQRSHEWTRRALRDDVLDVVKGWPLRAELGAIVVAHGSLDDPEQYVSSKSRCEREIQRLRKEYPGARVLVLGHTHKQRVHVEGLGSLPVKAVSGRSLGDQRVVVNPGSVGQSREWEWPPRARAAVLDTAGPRVYPVRVRYDVYGSWRDARSHGLTYSALHHPPSISYMVKRRGRALMRSRAPSP
jgi:predicted phosphodiesterase